MTARFLTPLRLHLLHEWDGWRPTWVLLDPLRYWSDVANREIVVRAGFVFDGESSPIYSGFTGPVCFHAGALHDWLYGTHELPKDLADSVYEEAMRSVGLDPYYADQRYRMVHDYGEGAYDSGPVRFRVIELIDLPKDEPYGALPDAPPPPAAPTPPPPEGP